MNRDIAYRLEQRRHQDVVGLSIGDFNPSKLYEQAKSAYEGARDAVPQVKMAISTVKSDYTAAKEEAQTASSAAKWGLVAAAVAGGVFLLSRKN